MRWIKLMKNIENQFVDLFKGKVQIYTTSYRTEYVVSDLFNLGCITVDGTENINFSKPDSFYLYGSD